MIMVDALRVREGRTPKAPEPELSETQRELIAEIRAEDIARWKDFVAEGGHERSLDIPPEVARILIPERLYAFANDPRQIDIVPGSIGRDQLLYFVVEHERETARDPKRWSGDISTMPDWTNGDRNVLHVFTQHPDRLTISHLIKSGALRIDDYLMLQVWLTRIPASQGLALKFNNYRDRPELQGHGIGRQMFEGLDRLYDLGFEVVAGEHEDHNVGFYTDALGRTPIADLNSSERNRYALGDPALMSKGTIQRLKHIE